MSSLSGFIAWNEKKPMLIPHLSSATGDTIHVAAALALYDRLDVIVIHYGKVDSCEGLLDFYRGVTKRRECVESQGGCVMNLRECDTHPNNRVKVVYAVNAETTYKISNLLTKKGWEDEFANLEKDGVSRFWYPTTKAYASVDDFCKRYLRPHVLPTEVPAEYTLVGNLGQATAAIASKFTSGATELTKLYTTLATKLSLPTLKASDIITVNDDGCPRFAGKALPSPNGFVALLWARYTGTNSLTEYNPEGDSSVKGQEQLLQLLEELKFNVITIGHAPRGRSSVASKFDVGEFYLQEPISKDRASQTSFFLALMQTYPGRLFQIGQKTGGMDCAALLGVPTLYLEHEGSRSRYRMLKWVDNVPFYQNSTIQYPPSRIGASLCTTYDKVVEISKLGKAESKSKQRASPRVRLACMLYNYPAEMDASEIGVSTKTVQDVVSWVDKMDQEALRVNLEESLGYPEADGMLAQRIRKANLSTKGATPLGYSDADVDEIKRALTRLRDTYVGETTVIRTSSGIYEARESKEIK